MKNSINWKTLGSLLEFYPLSDRSYAVKVINTEQLTTVHSKTIDFNDSFSLYIHILAASSVVIGYEIISKRDFELVICKRQYLFLGTNSLRPCTPKKIYEGEGLSILSTNLKDYLFILN